MNLSAMNSSDNNDISEKEIIEATKLFYSNCYGHAKILANVSSDCISELELKSIINGDSVAEFIAHQAKKVLQKNKASQIQKQHLMYNNLYGISKET